MLAEKYRPHTFAQVIGQDPIIRAMQWHLNQETPTGKVLLITGPSGSGKTTLAQCAADYWGIPKWGFMRVESAQCDASRLEEIGRGIRIYGPGKEGRKGYLIDEVHTITGRAHERMLSLLEELPRHVLIVGTTTEEGWCNQMLYSRWTRFALKRLSKEAIAQRLESVARIEGLPVPDDHEWALRFVAAHGINLRDQLNQLPSRLFEAAAPCPA